MYGCTVYVQDSSVCMYVCTVHVFKVQYVCMYVCMYVGEEVPSAAAESVAKPRDCQGGGDSVVDRGQQLLRSEAKQHRR